MKWPNKARGEAVAILFVVGNELFERVEKLLFVNADFATCRDDAVVVNGVVSHDTKRVVARIICTLADEIETVRSRMQQLFGQLACDLTVEPWHGLHGDGANNTNHVNFEFRVGGKKKKEKHASTHAPEVARWHHEARCRLSRRLLHRQAVPPNSRFKLSKQTSEKKKSLP
jgi:hypothetical protein